MAALFTCLVCDRKFPTMGGLKAHLDTAHRWDAPALEFAVPPQEDAATNALEFAFRIRRADPNKECVRTSHSEVAAVLCVRDCMKDKDPLSVLFQNFFSLDDYPDEFGFWPEIVPTTGMLSLPCSVCGRPLRYHHDITRTFISEE